MRFAKQWCLGVAIAAGCVFTPAASAHDSTGVSCHINNLDIPQLLTWPYERPTYYSTRIAPYYTYPGEAFRLHSYGPNFEGVTYVYGHTATSYPNDVWLAGLRVTCP